jgi:hypothetical protein
MVAAYALLRGYDALFRAGDESVASAVPAAAEWSGRIAMFWRVGVGAYAGGIVAAIVALVARTSLSRATRTTAVLVPVVGALIAVQGTLLP